MIGVWQLVLIFAIILVLFGAGKIPSIMKDIGSGLRAFKKGMEEDDDNDNKEFDFTIEPTKKSKIKTTKQKKNIKTNKIEIKNKKELKNKKKENIDNKKTAKVDNKTSYKKNKHKQSEKLNIAKDVKQKHTSKQTKKKK